MDSRQVETGEPTTNNELQGAVGNTPRRDIIWAVVRVNRSHSLCIERILKEKNPPAYYSPLRSWFVKVVEVGTCVYLRTTLFADGAVGGKHRQRPDAYLSHLP